MNSPTTTSKFLVYGLFDPRDGELRYVGKSCSGIKRPKQHLAAYSRNSHEYKARWLKRLAEEGFLPEIDILEEHTSPEALQEAEQFWISYFKSIGCRLTNTTPGGDGAARGNTIRRGKKDTEETRRKKSEANKGRVFSAESRAKMSLAQMGNKKGLGNKNRLGKPHSLESKINMSRGHGVRPFREVSSGQIFQTQNEAVVRLGVTATGVSDVLAGKYRTTKGYAFEYLE